MRNNKEYHFSGSIESVDNVIGALEEAGYSPRHYRKCDLEGNIVCHKVMIIDLGREYEVTGVEDCLKFIVNDAAMLGKMVSCGYVVEG